MVSVTVRCSAALDLTSGSLIVTFLRNICGTDALQRQSVSDAFIDDAAQFLGHGDPGVARGQWWQAGELFPDLSRASKKLVGRHDFVHRAPLPGGLGIEL